MYKKRPGIFIKMLNVAICAIVLSVGLCSAAIYLYLEPIIKQSIITGNQEVAVKMLQHVANSLEEMESYATNISFDDTVQDTLSTPSTADVYGRYSVIQRLERKLKEYVLLRSNALYGIFLVDDQNQVLELSKTYGDLIHSPAYERYREIPEDGGELGSGFTEKYIVPYNSSGGLWETVSYVCNIYNKQPPYQHIGKLVLMLNIGEIVQPLVFEQKSGILVELHNEYGDIIYTADPARNLEAELLDRRKNQTDHLFRHSLGDSQWYGICAISGRQVSEAFGRINSIILFIVAACLVLMLSVIGRIVSRIVRPLETLVNGMRQVSGGSRTERISVDTGDEIEEAAHVFNQMVADIDLHTQELLEAEKREHESHLQMLLYQINPHFLYNTLNCVICLARREDTGSIISLTKVFIAFLRTILRADPRSMTTLGEEIAYMNHYVSILQFSYNNIPDICWEVPEALLDIPLPKLILYPLVENSIFYGVIPAERACGVTIRVCSLGEQVSICVEDNGRGFRPEDLLAVQESLCQDADTRDHIGISNVNSRLRLIYGESARLQIESVFLQGTQVFFKIPRLLS